MVDIQGLGNVADHVRQAAETIATTFGIYRIGGFATSGHATNSDHYTGHAIDVPARGPIGDKIAEWALDNQARFNIKYVIWNRRIWYPGSGWKGYSGASPHTDHVHISFNKGAGTNNVTGSGNALDNNSGCNPLALLMLLSFKMLKWGGLVYGAFLTDWII